MILMLAGTGDALELARCLHAQYLPVEVSTATDHGAQAYRKERIPVRTGRIQRDGMLSWIRKKRARLLIDATHPFAAVAHAEAVAASRAAGIPCYRLERPPLSLPSSPHLHQVRTHREAADFAAQRGGTVLLTTGSKGLPVYARRLRNEPGVRLVVRLLPTVENLRLCKKSAIDQKQIVAMQGPFGKGIDAAMLRHFSADILITKESGEVGWIREKVQVATEMGVELVIIQRPALPPGMRVFHTPVQLVDSIRGGVLHG